MSVLVLGTTLEDAAQYVDGVPGFENALLRSLRSGYIPRLESFTAFTPTPAFVHVLMDRSSAWQDYARRWITFARVQLVKNVSATAKQDA